jgi:predicted MFS family arabinose efflux permease
LIARIRTREPGRANTGRRSSLWTDAVEGVRAVGRDPTIRALAVGWAAIDLFNAMLEAVVILYLTRSIGLPAGILGVVFAVGGVGFVVGALLPGRITSSIGVGPTMAAAVAVIGLSDLALPLAGHDLVAVALAVGFGQFFFGLGLTVFNVAQLSLRQAIVPDALMGRVGATLRIASAIPVPVGALIGGVLGQTLGLRETLALAALLETATALWIRWSPLWSLGRIDVLPEES